MVARRFVLPVLALSLGVARASAAATEVDAQPAARVNGVVISREMVRELVKSVIAANPIPPSSEELDQLTRSARDSLIELELLYQEAVARHIDVDQKDIDAEIQHTRARFQSADQFAAALARSGMTEKQLREDTRKTLATNRLLERVVWRDVKVSGAEARAFYDQNRKEFEHPEKVRIRDLLRRAPPVGPERDAVKREVEGLRAQIAKGASFAALARQHSDDGESAPRGGDLGWIARGKLPAAVESAAYALPDGGISKVIETPAGFHLVQVVERQKPGIAAFASVKGAIVQTLISQEKARRQAAFVDELKKKAKIEIVGE